MDTPPPEKAVLSDPEELPQPNLSLRATSVLLFFVPAQAFAYIEMFAGEANCYRTVKAAGHYSARLDVGYMEEKAGRARSNPMNILSPSGMALLGCKMRHLSLVKQAAFFSATYTPFEACYLVLAARRGGELFPALRCSL